MYSFRIMAGIDSMLLTNPFLSVYLVNSVLQVASESSTACMLAAVQYLWSIPSLPPQYSPSISLPFPFQRFLQAAPRRILLKQRSDQAQKSPVPPSFHQDKRTFLEGLMRLYEKAQPSPPSRHSSPYFLCCNRSGLLAELQ